MPVIAIVASDQQPLADVQPAAAQPDLDTFFGRRGGGLAVWNDEGDLHDYAA